MLGQGAYSGFVRMMTANFPILCAHLAVLKSLAEQTLPKDRAHLEGTIQLVSRALQTVARARQQPQNGGGPAAPLWAGRPKRAEKHAKEPISSRISSASL